MLPWFEMYSNHLPNVNVVSVIWVRSTGPGSDLTTKIYIKEGTLKLCTTYKVPLIAIPEAMT